VKLLRARGGFLAAFLLFLPLTVNARAWGSPPSPALPEFAGWQKVQSATLDRSGWGLPATDVPVMTEFGLQSLERDTYQRQDRKIQVEGYRFADAGGAYGAFTYYRPDNYSVFDLAQPHDQAASGDTHILFTRGDWLIRVTMDELTAMTASEMRELAARLSPTAGTSQLPSLPYYLPRHDLDVNSIHYAEGPAGFATACSWLPAPALGFNMGAEAIVGTYGAAEANEAVPAQMVVLAYPTPQIARSHLAALQQTPGVESRRTGPILVAVHGVSGAAADQLLQSVNYDADVTTVPPTPMGIEGLPSMILAIFVLCGFIILVSVVVGLLTGGLRVLLQRVLPRRFHKLEPKGLIQLHLD